MGVNIFLLERRPVELSVAGVVHPVGSLRRFWKVTELDAGRAEEMDASEAAASALPSPKAVMLADVNEMPLGSRSGNTVRAHLVIGWDEGRTSVTDMGWDYLPILGYAVRNPASKLFALHEECDGALYPLDYGRAVDLGLIGPSGHLLRRGQPVISACHSIRPYIAGYAEADCTFDDGRQETLLIAASYAELPDPSLLIGKRPKDLEHGTKGSFTSMP